MKTHASLWLLALVCAGALALASSCAGSSEGTEGSAEQGGDQESTNHMPGMDHGSVGMRRKSMETVTPESAGVRVEWASDPAAPLPDQPVILRYRVIDAESDQALTDLPLDHERQMHLILVSKDLTQFQHIHPEVADDEAYRVATEFPDPGTYVLYDEFVHEGQAVLDRSELIVGEESEAEASLSPDLAPKTIDGATIALTAPEVIRAGEEASFTYIVTEGERAVTDLEPYLGAAAHVALVSADTEYFAHVHGEAGEDTGEGHEGMGSMGGSPPAAFGPEVSFHHTFPRAGLYKVWAQFNRGGNVITVPYVVEVQ